MEPMRRPGDCPTGYESGAIKASPLLSVHLHGLLPCPARRVI
jgi:hypothetical protein